MATVTVEAKIAHLLRRTSFGPFPGQVERLAKLGVPGAIDQVLAGAPLPVIAPDISDDSSDDPIRWWLGMMANPSHGLHEKMTWFWHGLVTVSHDKVFWWNVEWPAHLVLRQYALGSYRKLLKKITVEPAMLLYLDGDWSTVDGPNENYGRELQELFTIGQANVTQQNVSNAALALTGWHVNWDTASSEFIDEDWSCLPSNQKVSFLGKQVNRSDGVVDAACDHPAMAGYIAGKLWYYLVGTTIPAAKQQSLAQTYRSSGLNGKALVKAILNDPTFFKRRQSRARYPVEWVTAAMAAMGISSDRQMAVDQLWQMGQVPFYPPSVAGWPVGLRWLSPSLALARAALAVESVAIQKVADASDPVAAALKRCSIYEPTTQTRAALVQARNQLTNKTKRAAVLLALCLASPEFALA
ncbi:MAG: hypothetical protein QOH61_833 [Chloroflexota bacterium]|jgi:uncharacterized protein (DUF1800 family)|nr:hypothetical protein [Chloroflexota bacterium]